MTQSERDAKNRNTTKDNESGRIRMAPPPLCPGEDLMSHPGRESPETEALPPVPQVLTGGLTIAAVDRQTAAALLIAAARRRGERPFYSTSANGEVIARIHANSTIARLFREADQILADGQPLVLASRWLCRQKLPERVATTDLFHDVARRAERERVSFYLLGATEQENDKAVATVRRLYPALPILGHCHGYLRGEALERKIEEINALGPDILWLGLGVPREQFFVRKFAHRLGRVGVIKTSGGLFDHLAEKTPRAPLWMQQAGFEWLWRASMEPRRLLWRYLTTNPRALYFILRYSR